MVLLVRHIPTWGGRCEKITAGQNFGPPKYAEESYERHGGGLRSGVGSTVSAASCVLNPKSWGNTENEIRWGAPKAECRNQNAQRSSAAPTVKPAPTEAISTMLPFFNLPSSMAVFIANGMVPAVVLP